MFGKAKGSLELKSALFENVAITGCCMMIIDSPWSKIAQEVKLHIAEHFLRIANPDGYEVFGDRLKASFPDARTCLALTSISVTSELSQNMASLSTAYNLRISYLHRQKLSNVRVGEVIDLFAFGHAGLTRTIALARDNSLKYTDIAGFSRSEMQRDCSATEMSQTVTISHVVSLVEELFRSLDG